MAKETRATKPVYLQTVGGMDESVEITNNSEAMVLAQGSFPWFYGMHHRMFGKKLIDWNPEQEVFQIHQAFNGICLYGYYVETNHKLYFHLCMAPPDLRIHFHGEAQITFTDSKSVHWRLEP